MKTKLLILSALAAMLLSGCELVGYGIIVPVSRTVYILEQQGVAKKIKAGDLDASLNCLYGCPGLHHMPEGTGRRAAENVLKAYQDDPDLDFKKLAFLMLAHESLGGRDVTFQIASPDEQLAHRKAIFQLAQSKVLWDYANDERPNPSYLFRRVQEMLSATIALFLVEDHSAKVSGDPYQALVCDLTAYKKEIFLIEARKDNFDKPLSPCALAQRLWGGRALLRIQDDIASGDLAAAERFIFEREKFRNNAESAGYLFSAGSVIHARRMTTDAKPKLATFRIHTDAVLHRAARLIISAYENTPNLNARQQEALKLSREIPLSSGCGGCR